MLLLVGIFIVTGIGARVELLLLVLCELSNIHQSELQSDFLNNLGLTNGDLLLKWDAILVQLLLGCLSLGPLLALSILKAVLLVEFVGGAGALSILFVEAAWESMHLVTSLAHALATWR